MLMNLDEYSKLLWVDGLHFVFAGCTVRERECIFLPVGSGAHRKATQKGTEKRLGSDIAAKGDAYFLAVKGTKMVRWI